MKQNPTRVDLLKHYQAIIAEYNQDKDEAEIQRVFEELLKTHDALNNEEVRYIREGFKDENALAVFDLLAKYKTRITKSDIGKIKTVAQSLMDALTEQQSVLANLRDRASTQAQMKVAIIDQLLANMPDDYSSEEIEARADVVFRYALQQIHYASLH